MLEESAPEKYQGILWEWYKAFAKNESTAVAGSASATTQI